MFRLSCASKAVRAIADAHGFTAVSLWEPMNTGRRFEDLGPTEVAVRVQDAKGRTLEITSGELRHAVELCASSERRARAASVIEEDA